jgi:hypothetical protein
MQRSWRKDHDKLTFVACLPLPPDAEKQIISDRVLIASEHDSPDRMVGDVNLFLSRDGEDKCSIGECVWSSCHTFSPFIVRENNRELT